MLYLCFRDGMIMGYADANYAKDMDRERSITGYLFKVMGNIVSIVSLGQSRI